MKLTKEEAIRLHRELWDWLAHNPSKEKEDWPKWENKGEVYSITGVYKGEQIPLYCFACYATNIQTGDYADTESCAACALQWPDALCDFSDSEDNPMGLYTKWRDSNKRPQKAKLARQIRDLPVREEVPNAPTT